MNRKEHWDTVYSQKAEAELSWHQDAPSISFELMQKAGLTAASSVIDIGGGTSRLVDGLLALGVSDITVLDLSEKALTAAQRRLGMQSSKVNWIAADVTSWHAAREYDFWHDRAVFHFLTDPVERDAYISLLSNSIPPYGHAIIAAFALDGPQKCSGLAVARYSPESLSETLGEGFSLLAHRAYLHHTPWGSEQSFQYSLFRKEA